MSPSDLPEPAPPLRAASLAPDGELPAVAASSALPASEPVSAAVRWRFPPMHREGRVPVAVAGVASILFLFFIWDELGFVLAGLTLCIAAFFRDPVRTVPRGEGLIVAPADGLVTRVVAVLPPRELDGSDGLPMAPCQRITIAMSLFDCHINRMPIGGTIRRVVYMSGRFLSPEFDKASEENERQHILIDDGHGLRVGFTQIAGAVSRRIVSFVKPGDFVARGQRAGMIRFGSRVDIYLPAGVAAQVAPGQTMVAGETVLGRIGETVPVTGLAQ